MTAPPLDYVAVRLAVEGQAATAEFMTPEELRAWGLARYSLAPRSIATTTADGAIRPRHRGPRTGLVAEGTGPVVAMLDGTSVNAYPHPPPAPALSPALPSAGGGPFSPTDGAPPCE